MEDIFETKEKNKNYILAEININKKNINKYIRIINTNETSYDDKNVNEKEIKENCIIKINNNIIPFKYFYKFKEKGKFIIEYSFKKNLTNTCCMFSWCNSLTNLNLSNFNTQNVTNMVYMFFGCNSLKKQNIISKDNKILNLFN